MTGSGPCKEHNPAGFYGSNLCICPVFLCNKRLTSGLNNLAHLQRDCSCFLPLHWSNMFPDLSTGESSVIITDRIEGQNYKHMTQVIYEKLYFLLHPPGRTSRMITDQKNNNSTTATFWLQLHKSWGCGLYASSSSEGAVELQQADVCARRERPGQAGPDWAGQLRFPSAPSSSEAKLILRLRPLWGGSAKACPPAAAGNCLQCRSPWNGKAHPLCVHMGPMWVYKPRSTGRF